ncbi:endolytic transglycosylase MltG [Williamsia herbipolensis]|uniref:Endolytic murein transglycosylase n=1 Tax=Williamsia herbipolensis TaxID=1603258 RepID=A0AAU4K3H2_9NOCA|nr:endolytic transglycosylase MltG [Williamsia herbipolensis]
MTEQPPRPHRRRADDDGRDPAETARLRRLIAENGSGHTHRRARGAPPRRPDLPPLDPRRTRTDDGRADTAGEALWQEPRRAQPRAIPPIDRAPERHRPDERFRNDDRAHDGGPGPSPAPHADQAMWAPVGDDPATAPLGRPDIPGDDPRRDPGPRSRRSGDRGGHGRRATAQMQARKRRRRVVLALVMVFMVAVIGSLGYVGLRMTGYFVDDDDYSNASGTGDVLVSIPQDSTLTQFGQILRDRGVVASVRAFTDAAGSGSISAGFYKLRTGIPAATAVSMLDGDANRVGRVVIPPGRQLDTKQTADGSPSTGIFAMIAQATTVTIDGRRSGVTQEQLAQAAATASPTDLGVPSWATADVERLNGDHRRIEGLIAPVAFEAIDPTLSPTAMLKYLITTSATLFDQWGLLDRNDTGLSPYQNLVSASVVEKEVADPDDYGKVARVILNRLGRNQKLEMDSTANYTAAVVNIDVSGDAYTADTKWNTYQVNGLPATPIGSVGKAPLQATDNPPAGNWIYFVAVDPQGTTLFTEDYAEHLRNRQKACDNKVLAVGCR